MELVISKMELVISITSIGPFTFGCNYHRACISLKVAKGGEDAFFVSSYNRGVIAVVDGVSGLTMILEFLLRKHMLLPHPKNHFYARRKWDSKGCQYWGLRA